MESEVIQSPPPSWITLCIEKGMCDAHLDVLCACRVQFAEALTLMLYVGL